MDRMPESTEESGDKCGTDEVLMCGKRSPHRLAVSAASCADRVLLRGRRHHRIRTDHARRQTIKYPPINSAADAMPRQPFVPLPRIPAPYSETTTADISTPGYG